MLTKHIEDVHLVFVLQLVDHVNDFGRIGRLDEADDVHVDEGGHQILAIEAVHNASVAGDHVAKVFDFEGSLEATGEEAAKRANDRAEQRQRQ